jgi:glycosyltransferase involved in cell wall biosynthesis
MVLHLVYNLIRGGTEGQCARVAMALAERGRAPRVAVFQREGFFLDRVEAVCGPVYELPIEHMVRRRTLREVRRLARFIRAQQIRLVHAWDADAAIFGSLAARWAGVPYMTSRRDLGDIYPRYKLALMRWADRYAAAVTVNAHAIRQRVADEGVPAGKIHRIPNLIDLEEFDAEQQRECSLPDTLPGGRRIGMVARLDPEKDTATLLQAFKIVCERVDDVGLIIAGDGPEMHALRQLADESGILPRVIFLGEVTDVPALTGHLDMGVLTPNANEGLSNTIMEYMAGGLPVVATDCGGNAELVQDGVTGWLAAVGDEQDVAAKIMKLLNNPEQARSMGAAGRKKVESEHTKDVVVDAFEQCYRDVMNKHPD